MSLDNDLSAAAKPIVVLGKGSEVNSLGGVVNDEWDCGRHSD